LKSGTRALEWHGKVNVRWSYQIGRIAGIPIHVHLTFLLLLAFDWLTEGGLAGVIFTLVVFGIVVLHELGHAMAARAFGIRTRDITLLPIGGVARLERMPERPLHELIVALAGPAVNALLAGLAFASLGLVTVVPALEPAVPFLLKFILVNVGLGLFNLIPAFPMDGGRAFRALLGIKFNYARATTIAARAGRVVAFGLGLVGLYTGATSLVLVAMFVWFAGRQEEVAAQRAAMPQPTFTGFVDPGRPEPRRFAVYDREGRLVAVYEA
jgi:Zn-dependent protease